MNQYYEIMRGSFWWNRFRIPQWLPQWYDYLSLTLCMSVNVVTVSKPKLVICLWTVNTNVEDNYLWDFLEILKRTLQNFDEISKSVFSVLHSDVYSRLNFVMLCSLFCLIVNMTSNIFDSLRRGHTRRKCHSGKNTTLIIRNKNINNIDFLYWHALFHGRSFLYKVKKSLCREKG